MKSCISTANVSGSGSAGGGKLESGITPRRRSDFHFFSISSLFFFFLMGHSIDLDNFMMISLISAAHYFCLIRARFPALRLQELVEPDKVTLRTI